MKRILTTLILFWSVNTHGAVMKTETWVRISNTNNQAQVTCFWVSQFKDRASENDRQIVIIVPHTSLDKMPMVKAAFRKFRHGKQRFSKAALQQLRDDLNDANIKLIIISPTENPATELFNLGWMPEVIPGDEL